MTTSGSLPDPQDLLPLTPAVFHILLALADGEKHGYAIMREVEEATDGALIEESHQPAAADPADKRRRYYRLSDFGRRLLRAETARLTEAVRRARAKRIFSQA